jgi:sulfite exporter TauE/SafE
MIWTGFILGFLGSLHCIGMCGPLMIAVPGASRVTYHLGRALAYGAMGLVFGAIGQTFALAGWQRGVSVAAGAVILVIALGSLVPAIRARAAGWTYRITAPLKQRWSRLIGKTSLPALLAMGFLNGLLPCGLVYVALAAAAGTGHAISGAALMLLFGFGTTPALVVVALFGRPLQQRFRIQFQRLVPAALVMVAALLILRGLNLGIPYISPVLAAEKPSCCHGP